MAASRSQTAVAARDGRRSSSVPVARPAASSALRRPASADCAGTGTQGGANLQIPDVESRQVQRRDGPHRAARRRRLEPGPLRGPAVPLPEHARRARRLHRERPRGRRLRAGLPEPVAQGLQLHHRHVVRVHGPDGDRGQGIPGHHLPPPDRLQVERHELRQLLRRRRGHEVPRRDARRVARQEGRQPEDRLHGDVPDPGGAAPRQRDHARRQADLPRVHDGRPLHQHLARPAEGARRPPTRCSTPGADVVFTGADTPAVADVGQGQGQVGASPTTIRARARTTPA